MKFVINTTKSDVCLLLHKICCNMVWKFCEIWKSYWNWLPDGPSPVRFCLTVWDMACMMSWNMFSLKKDIPALKWNKGKELWVNSLFLFHVSSWYCIQCSTYAMRHSVIFERVPLPYIRPRYSSASANTTKTFMHNWFRYESRFWTYRTWVQTFISY